MVPEPPSDGDLWPRVKATTGWPDTDEDRMRALGAAWEQAGTGFGEAGRTDVSGVVAAWPDEAGTAFLARAKAILDTATQGEQAMRQLAGAADAFAADVEHVKTEIGNFIRENIPLYAQFATLPGGADQGAQDAFVASVANSVNGFLDAVAAKIGAEGPGVQVPEIPDLPPPAAPEPESEVSVGDVAGMISAVSGTLALIPILAPVAAPIALVSGAVALVAHGTEMVTEEKWDDPSAWTDLVGDSAGLIPGVRGAGAVLDAARAVGPAATRAEALIAGAREAGQQAAEVAPSWKALGDSVAPRFGPAADGEFLGKVMQGGVATGSQVPTAVEWATEGETAKPAKDFGSAAATAANLAQLLP